MEDEPAVGYVRVLVKVVDAMRVDRRRPSDQPMHLVALLEQ
jgi:hypothetical protein